MIMMLIGLTACDDSDDSKKDTDDKYAYIQFYNTSKNAPSVYMKVGEKLSSGVAYGKTSELYKYDPDSYEVKLSWKEDKETYKDIYDKKLSLKKRKIQLLVISGDIDSPKTSTFEISSDKLDKEKKKFELKFLNMHAHEGGIDVHISKDSESFNEADMIENYSFEEFSDNKSYDLGSYKIYLTSAGKKEVLFESDAISFKYTSRIVVAIRQNIGPGESPFTIDLISKSSTKTYNDKTAGSEYRVFNAISEHKLLPLYKGEFDLHLSTIDDSPEISALTERKFSTSKKLKFGDYNMDLTPVGKTDVISKNHLLSLTPNSDKTVFFYLHVKIDDDDETKVYVNHTVIDNDNSTSLYSHQMKILNFIDDDEITAIKVYFVKSNETIKDAQKVNAVRAKPALVTLLNNTYEINVIAQKDNSDIILAKQTLTLDKKSANMFLVLTENEKSTTGYELVLSKQND
jgi:hypothetical protein